MPELDGLVARLRRLRGGADPAAQPQEPSRVDPGQDRLRELESRIAHLEQLVQGLQDSVHREASRQTKRITELEARTQPGPLGKALDEDARARGL